MPGAEYSEAVEKLGFQSFTAFAKWFGIAPRQAANWKNDGVPKIPGMLLRLMLHLQESLGIEDIPAWIDSIFDGAPSALLKEKRPKKKKPNPRQ
jgi:hypothetical protein